MWLVALEEQRMLAVASNTKDLTVIAGRNVKIFGFVERERPNVFGLGIEVNRGSPAGFGFRLPVFFRSPCTSGAGVLNLVNLAVRIRRGIKHAVLIDDECLNLQFLWLKNRRGLATGNDSVHTRRGASRGVNLTLRADRRRPYGARWRACDQLE